MSRHQLKVRLSMKTLKKTVIQEAYRVDLAHPSSGGQSTKQSVNRSKT